jgi:hypothetical protein
MKKTKKKSEHYVNNKDFYAAVIELRYFFNQGKQLGHANNKVTIYHFQNHPDRRVYIRFKKCYEYLGDCFLRIANHLAYKPNFVNYMFKDDMICDGIENCIQYVDNYDTERTNPFAYFTQIVYYAFLRRIAKEKRQLEIKSKIIERSGFDEVFSADTSDLGGDYSDMNGIKDSINYRFTV